MYESHWQTLQALVRFDLILWPQASETGHQVHVVSWDVQGSTATHEEFLVQLVADIQGYHDREGEIGLEERVGTGVCADGLIHKESSVPLLSAGCVRADATKVLTKRAV